MAEDDYLTIRAASERIGVSPRQVLNYIQTGRLIAARRYGVMLVERKAADKFKRPNRGRKPEGNHGNHD